MYKKILILGIISLFFVSAVTPITFGYNVNNIKTLDQTQIIENFDSYHMSEITKNTQHLYFGDISNTDIIKSNQIDTLKEIPTQLDGPMDSPWPMYCHDVKHTGRSPYSTSNNFGSEKWKFWTEISGIQSGIVISDDDTIYFSGSYDIYALYPDGTLKWRYDSKGVVLSCPAIDENGVIYVGSAYDSINGDHLYAIYPDGTLKWKYFIGDNILSSPAIGEDGTIYFGSETDYIYALYPNGTLKWKYLTSVAVLSSPAIGDDGTVYCGSHDTYLYALYPNNGTLKWRYKTGHWIRVSPCIADDGIIYVVSLDDYLHAVYPNGTLKWKTHVGAGTSPTIGQDGTIYAGYTKLHAVNPTDGSVEWSFDVQGKIRGATPCNSIDGTIYLGNSEGSDIVAVNPDGTEKWRKTIEGDVESAPAIGKDGTVYIGSQWINGGYLHAFGYTNPNPLAPTINGPTSGKPGTPYTYTFKSIDPDGDPILYYIDWDDGNITDWSAAKPSGEPYTESHTWTTKGTYTIRAKAKDTDEHESDWGELEVTMLRNKATNNILLLNLLERFPLLQKLIQQQWFGL